MNRVHLVYPHGDRISCPDAIGNHLAAALRRKYSVVVHDWDAFANIHPSPGSILVGHPHPVIGTAFRASARNPGWKRIIALAPFDLGNGLVPFILGSLIRADTYLAITGPYWFDQLGKSPYAPLLPKTSQVDLAVDRGDFPPIKRSFNPPGLRRFVYIGRQGKSKNLGYLSAIAQALPEFEFAWMGDSREMPGLKSLGYLDFRDPGAKDKVAGFDFLISVAEADSNPATILEAMAWGLIPVCTPQSGYVGRKGIVNIPLSSLPEAVRILNELQGADDGHLRTLQGENWAAMDTYFNWDRFCAQVLRELESEKRMPCGAMGTWARARLQMGALGSHFSPLRLRNLKLAARSIQYRASIRSVRE